VIFARSFPALLILSAAPAVSAQNATPPRPGPMSPASQDQRVYLGFWADPALTNSGSEKDIEVREGPPPLGIGRRFALHLHYVAWTGLAAELDGNGVLQPDAGLKGDIDNGRTPVVSWNCDPTQNSNHIIAGGDPGEDTTIAQTAQALKQYPGPVLLRWFWEFNVLENNTDCRGDNGGTPTQKVYNDFIGAWQHIRTIFREQGADNVLFLWNPGDYPTEGDKRDPHGFYPGNDYVDWIGIDSYQRLPTDAFSDDFGLFYADFSGPQYGYKPLIVGENGAQNAQGGEEIQQTYLDGLLEDVLTGKYPQLRAYDYFDQIGNSGNWSLDSGGLAALTVLGHDRAFSRFPFRPDSRVLLP